MKIIKINKLRNIEKIVEEVIKLEMEVEKLTDMQLKKKTDEFTNRYKKGESLDSILPDAFSVCREASYRVLGMKHYKEQIMGGIILHQGRIAEMKTGEGKTLVATLAVYLNALSGEGVHVITANEYLAKRDKQLMERLYDFLGLSSEVLLSGMSKEERKSCYKSDITYGTGSEFGFDYLRDNMVYRLEDKVQRKLKYVIVDEIDSILIDEARTPLIITNMEGDISYLYEVANDFVSVLNGSDYDIDKKIRSVYLKDSGIEKVEKLFSLECYAEEKHIELHHYINQALKANYLMKKDEDYIVKENQVHIVDETTGRVMVGRRYSDGLHQAIERKEGLEVRGESRTVATITYQNFFKKYEKLSGMTGTASTENNEFKEVYNIDVVQVPTHKPILRIDREDKIYFDKKSKYNAIINEIIETNKKKQPVLVGTTSIEQTEYISKLLEDRGVFEKHILNAKNNENEAVIVAKAGEKGRITIATNMAGRGTDIKLGLGVCELGGLKIIGTEKHESRRIDNQLKGRAGRQGDPGETIFFISLEDDIMKIFGSDKYKKIFAKYGNANGCIVGEDKKKNKNLIKIVEESQKSVESNSFDTRKNLVAYDEVINKQREIIYTERDKVIAYDSLEKQINLMLIEVIAKIVNIQMKNIGIKKLKKDDKEIKLLIKVLDILANKKNIFVESDFLELNKEEIKEIIIDKFKSLYKEKAIEMGNEKLRDIEKSIVLSSIDKNWIEELKLMEKLKKDIKLVSYKQVNPIQLYQIEGMKIFNEMLENLKLEIIQYILSVKKL